MQWDTYKKIPSDGTSIRLEMKLMAKIFALLAFVAVSGLFFYANTPLANPLPSETSNTKITERCTTDADCFEGCPPVDSFTVTCLTKTEGSDMCLKNGNVSLPIGGLRCGCLLETHACGYFNPSTRSKP